MQGYDINNSIYLLVNWEMMDDGKISIPMIESEISRLYDGEFSVMIDER